MMPVMMGERLTFEFKSFGAEDEQQLLEIVDYDYLPTPTFVESIRGKDVQSTHVLMTLLSDNSVVLTSVETGQHLLWFELDLSSLDDDDKIADFKPSFSGQEPFFAILTKKGRLLIFHYTMIDNPTAQKKYSRHFKSYDRNVTDICRDRLKPSLNTACREEDYKT